jgi:prepilin-type N-terminal cleavage/methylation domain-containing protein
MRRLGFTLIEMLLVVVFLGLLSMIAYPRLKGPAASLSVSTARQQATEMLLVARTTAVQAGAETRFIRSGNVVRAVMDSSGSWVTLAARDLYADEGVTLASSGSAPHDTVRFDARGVAIGLTASQSLKFTNLTAVDSICVTRVGKVTRGGCPT